MKFFSALTSRVFVGCWGKDVAEKEEEGGCKKCCFAFLDCMVGGPGGPRGTHQQPMSSVVMVKMLVVSIDRWSCLCWWWPIWGFLAILAECLSLLMVVDGGWWSMMINELLIIIGHQSWWLIMVGGVLYFMIAYSGIGQSWLMTFSISNSLCWCPYSINTI